MKEPRGGGVGILYHRDCLVLTWVTEMPRRKKKVVGVVGGEELKGGGGDVQRGGVLTCILKIYHGQLLGNWRNPM